VEILFLFCFFFIPSPFCPLFTCSFTFFPPWYPPEVPSPVAGSLLRPTSFLVSRPAPFLRSHYGLHHGSVLSSIFNCSFFAKFEPPLYSYDIPCAGFSPRFPSIIQLLVKHLREGPFHGPCLFSRFLVPPCEWGGWGFPPNTPLFRPTQALGWPCFSQGWAFATI